MGDKLFEVRKTIDILFLGEDNVKEELIRIVDETEQFVRSYEMPRCCKALEKNQSADFFFDCAFD